MAKGTLSASFEIESGSAPEFLVVGLEGEEELSRPYRFEIDLTCTDPNVDLAALIHSRATLTLEFRHRRKIHGVIGAFEMCGQTKSRLFRYRALLIPTMAKLQMSEQTQIYGRLGESSLFDIVLTELTGRNARGVAEDSAARVLPEDVDIRLPRDEYSIRDYIVQYQESDLNFVQRLLEHHGVHYFFNHEGEREAICFGDSNAAFDDLTDGDGYASGRKTMEFRPPADAGAGGATSVHTLVRRRNPVVNRIVLREHNYRSPLGLLRQPDYLHTDETVDPQGHGAIVLEGEHFLSAEEGERLTRIRVEELLSRQEVFTGTSDNYRFCPGFAFELAHHMSDACNQDYLITRVYHRAGERLAGDGPGYTNEFTAIPLVTPFRPERRTPKPRVSGLFYAHIDAGGPGTRAEIDSMGRYKIRMPFDLSGAERGAASRFVRMAQPYSGFSVPGGESSGMHFPLMKGTEVIIGCINGDPDRPIIVGTVPNARSGPPVTSANRTKNQIRTASGILMEFEDGSGQ